MAKKRKLPKKIAGLKGIHISIPGLKNFGKLEVGDVVFLENRRRLEVLGIGQAGFVNFKELGTGKTHTGIYTGSSIAFYGRTSTFIYKIAEIHRTEKKKTIITGD